MLKSRVFDDPASNYYHHTCTSFRNPMFQIRDCRGKGIEPDIKTWDPAYTVRADVAGLLEILSWNKVVFWGLFKCRG